MYLWTIHNLKPGSTQSAKNKILFKPYFKPSTKIFSKINLIQAISLPPFKRLFHFSIISLCDLKVARSVAKIDENFANYFWKLSANNKCFIVLKCTCKGIQKSINELIRAVKSKSKALRHFKVDPILKIDDIFYKQAESLWINSAVCIAAYVLTGFLSSKNRFFLRQILVFR